MGTYCRILEDLLLPLHNTICGRKYVVYRRFLEKSQWWPAEQLMEFQWSHLQALLRLAFTAVPFYRRRYAEVGATIEEIRNWDDFRRLPPLTRTDVEQNREDLTVANLGQSRHLHATGGSSGRPVRFYRTIESYDWRTAATQRVYSWSGCRPGERTLYLWGAPVGRQKRLQVWKTGLHNLINRTAIIPTFVHNSELWQRVYNRVLAFRPRFFVGFVSSLLSFARFLESEKLERPLELAAVLTAAEPLTSSVRDYLREILGVPVFNTYGSREFMSIGGECSHQAGIHVNAENLVVETVDAATDRASDILVTDLHNQGTVFLRYAIGDTGTLAVRQCPCGRGLPMLSSVDGPNFTVLQLASGHAVSPLMFRHLLKDIHEVLEYQVRQRAPDHVVIAAVLRQPLSPQSRTLFDTEMRKVKVLGGVRVDLEPVPEIPKGPSGKMQPVIALKAL